MKSISEKDIWLVQKFYARFGDGKSSLAQPPIMSGMYEGLRQKLFGGGLSYEEICLYWKDFKKGIKKGAISFTDLDHNTISLFRDYILWKKHKYSFVDLEHSDYLKMFFQKQYRDEVIEAILKDKI